MTPLTPAQYKERHRAYSLAFTSIAGQAVLRDLAEFCRAKETTLFPEIRPDRTTHSIDPYMAIALASRREVWLHIEKILNLTNQDIDRILGGQSIPPDGDPNVSETPLDDEVF